MQSLLNSNSLRQLILASMLPLFASAGNGANFKVQAIEPHTLKPAEGFELSLFAMDPAIAKPIQMNFDHKGRLWVVSSESYPQLKPGAKPSDKVFVLEDTEGDGKADKTSLYANGLLIPTGIEIGSAGAYIGQSTELVRIDHVGTPGRIAGGTPQTVLSGFGTEDTHHLIHTLRWSPDGWLFFGQSIYIHSHVETPWGVKRLNGGGFWMFRPESHRLETFVHGMVNSWGIAWDEFGQAFGVDNDDRRDGSSIKWFLPGARFEFTPNEADVLQGVAFNKPKYCGAEFIVGEQFPPEFRGNFVTCDFRAHRVVRYRIEDDGAGFKAVELEPLITSLDPNFRPVDVKFGPDGALYICDWYNPIINHGEVDFRDPRRDKLHGRIWRLTAKGRPIDKQPNFSRLTVPQLVELQGSPNGWTRNFSRRALVERQSSDVADTVAAWLKNGADERRLLAGLWTCEAVHRPNLDLIDQCLSKQIDPRICAEATRIAGLHLRSNPQLEGKFAELVTHANPRVRLEAVRALTASTNPFVMSKAIAAYEKPTDRFIEYSLRLLARETADNWLPILTKEVVRSENRTTAQWIKPLLAIDRTETVAPLLALFQRGVVAPSEKPAVLTAIGRRGNPEQLRRLLEDAIGDRETPVSEQITVLNALMDATRLRGVRPAGNLNELVAKLISKSNVDLSANGLQLAGLWQLSGLSGLVRKSLIKPEATTYYRIAAIEALRDLGGAENTAVLASLAANAGQNGPLAIGQASIAALLRHDAARAAAIVVDLWTATSSETNTATLIEPFVHSKSGPNALAKVLIGKKLKPDLAKETVRLANASGQLLPELLSALGKAGGLPIDSIGPSPAALTRLAGLAIERGNADRGRQIYRREKLQCVKCHQIGSEGGAVGPALTTIGMSAPVDYLVESLLAPNRKVKENYHSLVIATTAGQVLTGIPVKKTTQELVLRNAENKLVSIATRDIESSRDGGSIMPAGLVDTLGESELVDLVRYLSELGKPSVIGAPNLARRWLLLGPFTAEDDAKLTPQLRNASKLLMPPWQQSWTTNDGWVYLREYSLKPQWKALYAIAELEVKSAGKFRIALRPSNALVALDNKPLLLPGRAGQDSLTEAALSAGRHRFYFRIDLSSKPSQLRLEATPLDNSARAEFVEPSPR